MKRVFIGLVVLSIAFAVFNFTQLTTLAARPIDPVWVEDMVARFGSAGPFALIGLMVLAIVVSPIPSGPIAIAAGMLYGTMWGGVLSVIGALIGALVAFSAARYLGFDAVRRSPGPIFRYLTAPRSRTDLMCIVFVSRLVPFISFDLVSYAAGLTALSFWQFALATLLGIVPICLALAAVGAGVVRHVEIGMTTMVMVSCVTLTPFILRAIWRVVRHPKDTDTGRGPKSCG